MINPQPRQSNYLADYQKARENGQPWIVVISEDWCGACNQLKNTVARLQGEGLAFHLTYLKSDDEHAVKIVKQSKREDKHYIPFWNVWQFKDGKFVRLHSQVGITGLESHLRRFAAK